MNLRKFFFLVASFVIGLSLSLYFQSEESSLSFHPDHYQGLTYVEERSHSLADLNSKLKPIQLLNLISEIHAKNRLRGVKTRVLEIGTGNGRVLMELKKKFPQVEFYGINKKKTHTFFRRESFMLTALKFGIFSHKELEHMELPHITFQDLDFGNQLPHKNEFFDLVFSQYTFEHIRYKFELLNEVLRVLKIGAISLHSDFKGVHIYSQGLLIGQKDAFAFLRKKGLPIKALDNDGAFMFTKPQHKFVFELRPHKALPKSMNDLSQELKKPEMGYNL